MLKRVAVAVAVAIGLGLVYFGLILRSEQHMTLKADLFRAKADLIGIDHAVRLFHDGNGRYPLDLTELTRSNTDGKEPWLLPRVPTDPWGGAYQYRVQAGPAGESYKVWVVPDKKAQDAVGVAELSNTTDWRAIGIAR